MITLHFAPMSRAVRVAWLLEELGLDYELNKMEFSPKHLKSDEHRARHPLGRVPVLEEGDLMLWESGAIIEYILERHKNGGLKPSVDDSRFPKYLQWFHYAEGMVMPPVNTIMVHGFLLPPARRDEATRAQAEKLLKKALVPINEVLQDQDYLIGDFSAADTMLGHACIMSGRLACIDEDQSNISAYVERLTARPAFIKADGIR